jgi:hypothetical protein
MSKPYCGSKTVPKNKRLGSMKECVEKGQVCLYGLRKVDSRLVKNTKKPESKTKLYKLYGKLMGEKRNLDKKLSDKRNKSKASEFKKQLEVLNTQIKTTKEKLSAVKRSGSRKRSR